MPPKNFVIGKRAISNLIATLILIAVAVVGGAFAYTAFRNQSQSTTATADIQVQSLEAVKPNPGGDATVSITVKNIGTQRLDSVSANIEGDDTLELEVTGGIEPGATVSDSSSVTGLEAGKSYVVVVKASIANGGYITKTMTVRVQS